MENSKIEWTHHTFNPWRGCTKVSPGCANCYAETLSHRNPKVLGEWGPTGIRVIASESYWSLPRRWNREAVAAGERRRVFCLSLGDVAEERTELLEPRRRLFQLIAETQQLDWLLLTKRPQVALENWPLWAGYYASVFAARGEHDRVAAIGRDYELPNVWMGVSVEDRARWLERVPLLKRIPARIHFVSAEPLLGDLGDISDDLRCESCLCPSTCWCADPRVNWIIVGGESGHAARPMHPDSPHSIREQCQAAGTAFFFKQWGEWYPIQQSRLTPVTLFARVGKEAAGRLLDGREWSEFPSGSTIASTDATSCQPQG